MFPIDIYELEVIKLTKKVHQLKLCIGVLIMVIIIMTITLIAIAVKTVVFHKLVSPIKTLHDFLLPKL